MPATDPLSFRPMGHSDLLLQRWLQRPNNDAWWHEPLDLSGG